MSHKVIDFEEFKKKRISKEIKDFADIIKTTAEENSFATTTSYMPPEPVYYTWASSTDQWWEDISK